MKINTKKREFPLEEGKLTQKRQIPFEKVEINTKKGTLAPKRGNFPLKKGN